MRRTSKFFQFFVFISFAVFSGSSGADGISDVPMTTSGVTAHRGYSARYVENTMPAFEAALELDVDWLECDVFLSADGQLVVTHDLSTQRLTGVDAIIKELDYATIKEMDTAVDFRREYGKSIGDVPAQRMPLLREVIALVMQQDRVRLSIQPKDESTQAAVALIRELGAEDWTGFNDGNLQKMMLVKELAPEIPVFWDRPPVSTIDDVENDIRIASDHGFESLVYNQAAVEGKAIELVHSAGLEYGVWTVNDPELMQRFIALGVDRLYTDHPDTALRLFESR